MRLCARPSQWRAPSTPPHPGPLHHHHPRHPHHFHPPHCHPGSACAVGARASKAHEHSEAELEWVLCVQLGQGQPWGALVC
eukprot:scaffold66830_cov19-Tisochrysis_lutea.AAC.1